MRKTPCWDLWSWLHLWRRSRGVSWQGSRLCCWCSWGGLRPEPTEDLQIRDQVGAKPVSRAPVHDCAQGDLRPQVHHPPAGRPAPPDQVVSRPHRGCSWGVLWRRECSWRTPRSCWIQKSSQHCQGTLHLPVCSFSVRYFRSFSLNLCCVILRSENSSPSPPSHFTSSYCHAHALCIYLFIYYCYLFIWTK